jgi:hypothetical protein
MRRSMAMVSCRDTGEINLREVIVCVKYFTIQSTAARFLPF